MWYHFWSLKIQQTKQINFKREENEMGTKILSLLILATKFNALGCDNGNEIQQKIHTKKIAPHFKFLPIIYYNGVGECLSKSLW